MPTAELSALRAGDEVDGVFACTRKDRLIARTGTPYLALELRDRTSALPARVFRDADLLGGRFDRGDLVRVPGRVERFRDELQIDVRAIERADGADPAAFLPVAYRDLDELDGFLEHLAREVHEPGYAALLEGLLGDAALRAAWRRAPCTRAGHHAYLGGLLEHTVAVATLALETCQLHPRLELRPADLRRARARPRQDARVHLRRGDRAHRGGPAARPRRARPRSCSSRACADLAPERRVALLHCVLTPPRRATPRPAAASARPRRSRSTASTRSTRPSRARWSTACPSRALTHSAVRRPGCRAS